MRTEVRLPSVYVVKLSLDHEICKRREVRLTPLIIAMHHDRVSKDVDVLPTWLPRYVLRIDSGAGSFHGSYRSQPVPRLNLPCASISFIFRGSRVSRARRRVVRRAGRVKRIRNGKTLRCLMVVENNLWRPLADGRADRGTFADKVGAVRVWLKDGVGDHDAGTLRTGAEMLNPSKASLLGVAILAAAVTATDEEEQNSPQDSQDSAASNDTTDYGHSLWVCCLGRC